MNKNHFFLYFFILILSLNSCNSTGSFVVGKMTVMPSQTLSISIKDTSTAVPLVTKSPDVTEMADLSIQKCNRAAPGQPMDLTIPDGTLFRSGEVFSKTWRLVNNGICPWTPDYSLVWFSGAQIGVYSQQQLGKEVMPGDHIDITVDMVAPQKPGTYQSNWKLLSSDGDLYGIGPDGSAPFWVRIKVFDTRTQVITPTPTVSPQPLVYNSGNATLKTGEGIDLDMSGFGDDLETDLTLSIGKDNKLQLEPKNGAKITLFSMKLPTEKDCRSASLSSEPFPLDRVSEGTYICYRSQIGLTGYARIIKIDLHQLLINFEYLTWAAL